MDRLAAKVLEHVDSLIEQQEAVLHAGEGAPGKITRIEEYRAGVMLRRSMRRIRDEIERIYKEDDADLPEEERDE